MSRVVMLPPRVVMLPSRVVMLPSRVVMLPSRVVMLPSRVVMLPANAAEDIAKVKSEAQRIEVKGFILILLVSSSYWWTVRWLGGLPLSDVKLSCRRTSYQLVRALLFQGSCHCVPVTNH